MSALCAWCEAPRQDGPICPSCGADYAKAEAIKSTGKAPLTSTTATPATEPSDTGTLFMEQETIPVQDPAFEQRMCLIALPGMLVFAALFEVTGFLSGMQRIFFGMPIHELGHAVTGWLCGFNAIPTFWVTISAGDRGYISSVLLLCALAALVRYSVKTDNKAWLIPVLLTLVFQIYGTLFISLSKADMFFILGGDAMGMVLATILMSLFYVGKDTQIYKGALRWGFLGIGAAAFVDMFIPWWNEDISAIGYGLTGGQPTDSWKLINIYLWDWEGLFTLQQGIGLVCLALLTLAYTLGLKQANAWVAEQKRAERLERLRSR